MSITQKKIKQLADYFNKRPEVAMAFLFGSIATGKATSESDADIAIYFWPAKKSLEWEEDRSHKNEDEIWSNVEKIIGLKTDLVVLNRAPATLAFSAIREGVPLTIKDRGLFLRFLLTVSAASEEFQEYVDDFWQIKQRSRSLNKADRERLIKMADFLESELEYCPKFKDLDEQTYEEDDDKRRSVERWTENIVNSSIDIAKILLASNKKKIPQTYREAMENLKTLKGFDAKIAMELSRFAKLRNLLAHEYLDIRYRNIQQFVQKAEPLYQKFIKYVKKVIADR